MIHYWFFKYGEFHGVICLKDWFLVTFRKIAKSDSFIMPVRLSAWYESIPTEWIVMKFDI